MTTENATMVPGSGAVDFALRGVLDELVIRVLDGLGDHCRGILLGGSLARGQGMAWTDGERESLLSDVDVYVVREGARAATEAQLTRELRAEADRVLGCDLDLAFVTEDELRQRAATLHLQQLRHGHRTLHLARQVSVDQWLVEAPVRREESQRLLLNRLCEHARARVGSDRDRAVFDLKLLIDAPLAVLGSFGAYHPSRSIQRERLREVVAGHSPKSRERMDQALTLGEQWRRDALHSVMDETRLRRWHEEALRVLPEFGASCIRCTLLATWMAADLPSLSQAWQQACTRDRWSEQDGPVLLRWRRRGGRAATLRRARQWAPLAPLPVRPWWWHGWGGSGADRIYAAGVLRWNDDPDWAEPLRALGASLPEASRRDAWFAQLWADWILGKGRR